MIFCERHGEYHYGDSCMTCDKERATQAEPTLLERIAAELKPVDRYRVVIIWDGDDSKKFSGEWVAIPSEDWTRIRALLDSTPARVEAFASAAVEEAYRRTGHGDIHRADPIVKADLLAALPALEGGGEWVSRHRNSTHFSGQSRQ